MTNSHAFFKMAAISEMEKNEEELLLHVSPEEEKEEEKVLEELKLLESEEGQTDASTIRYPPQIAEIEDLPNNRIKRYINDKGNFITGIDINSEELVKKKATRHERFGTEVEVTSKEEIKINERAKRFGISSTNTGEIIRYIKKLPEIPEGGETRPEGLVVHGTNDMSTKDIFNVFTEYGPKHIEWINDVSCVVVWEDSSSAQRAFLGKGVWPVLEEGVSEGSSPLWRKGPAGLLLRIATSLDVKEKNSRAKSDYYKKYGNPGDWSRERRKRPRNEDLRQRLEEKKHCDDDDEDEMELTEVKHMKQEAEEEEEREREEDTMDLEVSSDTMISDRIMREGGPPPNDLRHKLGTSKKRQLLKSRLGPFPSL